MKKIIFSLAILTVLFTGCKKDDEPAVCTLSNASIMGSYKLTAMTYKASASAAATSVINDPNFNPTCEADNVIMFSANNVFALQDAGVVCSPSQSFSGTYNVANGVATVTYTIPGAGTFTDIIPISSFSCSQIVVTETDVNVTGDVLTQTYTRQ